MDGKAMDRYERIAVFALVLALLIHLGPSAWAANERVIEVVYQDFSTAAARDLILNELVPEFESRHPGVRVDVTFRSWSGYIDYYTTRHLGGTPPDVINIGSSGLGQFAASGLIQPIDDFLAEWPGLDDLVPAALTGLTFVDGHVYGLPVRLDVRGLWYLTALFQEAGLDPTRPPETWDELREYARRLVRRDSEGNIIREGFDLFLGTDDWHQILGFLYQAGLDVFRLDNTTDLNSPEGLETLRFLWGLFYEDQVATPSNAPFLSGGTAMQYDVTGLMTTQDVPPDALGLGLPPGWKRQTSQVHINSSAISSGSKHPDLAFEWITFMLEPENLARMADVAGYFPARISPSRMHPFTSDPRWQTWFQIATLSTPVPGNNPNWNRWLVDVLIPTYRDILNNRVPVENRLIEAERQTQALFGAE